VVRGDEGKVQMVYRPKGGSEVENGESELERLQMALITKEKELLRLQRLVEK
jgi:hypothetical protein